MATVETIDGDEDNESNAIRVSIVGDHVFLHQTDEIDDKPVDVTITVSPRQVRDLQSVLSRVLSVST